jgi:hypothetical protein
VTTLAGRIVAQGLAERAGDTLSVLRSWIVQDSPPGAAAAAIAARADTVALDEALEGRSAIALYNARTATAVVPADEAAAFATGFLPEGDAALKAVLGQALPGRSEGLAEPVQQAVDAISDALDGRTLTRDALHEELRGRLPQDMLPWCEGCGSHHARRGLLVLAGLRGRLCIAGRAGRQPTFARTDQLIGWDPPAREEAGAELARRFRAAYPGATRRDFTAWAGLGTAHAKELWERAGAPPPLPDAGPVRGVRLLAAGDPLLLARDREILAPDAQLRRKLFRPTGAPGVVLSDGRVAGLWRARKAGTRLEVTVEKLARLGSAGVEQEAERLAPLRGCRTASVAWR